MSSTALRLALADNGYTPIPLFGKEPPTRENNKRRRGLTGWSDIKSVSPEQIEMWTRSWPDAGNTGCLTRLMPSFDIDILNEDAARAIEDHAREHHGEHGYILVRIGLPPKRAIPFRTDEPFTKIEVKVVAANGKPEKIEFLGDGQQLVVNGIHPDTGQPYRWHGGEPWQVERDALPYIREAEARSLVDESAEMLIRDFGCTRARERPKVNGREPASAWRALVCDGVAEGDRNQAATKLAGHLLRRYVDPLVVLELVTLWNDAKCRPPLPHNEIVATVNSIARRELARRQAR